MSRMTVCISCKGDGKARILGIRQAMRCLTCRGMGRVKYSRVVDIERNQKAEKGRLRRLVKKMERYRKEVERG